MGFRLGNYAQGSVHVSSPEEISFVPESMKKVVKVSRSSPKVKNHLSCLYHTSKNLNLINHCGHTTTAIWVSSPTPVL